MGFFLICLTGSDILIGAETEKPKTATLTAPAATKTQAQPFNPIGKTEDELVAIWGNPKGRMDMGEETQLMFNQGTITLKGEKVITFVPQAYTPPPSSGSSSSSTRTTTSKADTNDEAEVYLKRLRGDLDIKQKELYEQQTKLTKETEEINAKYQESVSRASRDYYNSDNSYGSYSARRNNAENDRQKAVKEAEERLGISKLKEDIKQLEEDIRSQKEKMSR